LVHSAALSECTGQHSVTDSYKLLDETDTITSLMTQVSNVINKQQSHIMPDNSFVSHK